MGDAVHGVKPKQVQQVCKQCPSLYTLKERNVKKTFAG